ncbi:3-keto-disaccharide hydrolase [Mucilaginibacter ginkgonis]|uniref:DUF1080 domain-containing protein n=1 Tax=Mucilaginibacter ginkgonis TaxID=2682091 RepID=A0A6I4I2Z3_9SPHI|nr:DUF1080 domain-containing protein [Mucilaginibacter ginkgonis]QQL50912.1 DUF1080 domain-containing protein [Mucilaginibacter ginkgonis]
MKNFLRMLPAIGIAALYLLPSKSVNAQSAGWQDLFNGKTLKGWHRVAGAAEYSVEGGAIVGKSVAGSGNTFLITDKEYSDFILELDAKVDDITSNSGIQIRSHFNTPAHPGKVFGRQVEIDPSARAWTGGVYDEARREWLYPLDLHPEAKTAFKLGEYNHIRIECIGNETKTWVNNIPIAYVVDTVDYKGFIGLQVHAVTRPEEAGKKVYFKNIRIKTVNLKPEPFPAGIYVVDYVPNHLNTYEQKDGWKLMYNGSTTDGWVSGKGSSFPAKGWDYQRGTMTVLSSEGKESQNGGDIVTTAQYGAFDMSFQFKLTAGANSGVKYFVTLAEKTDGSNIGLEYQVLDDELHPDAKLGRNGDRKQASLYDLFPANKQARFVRPIGAWNDGRIVVYPDNRVEHYLNGVKVLEYKRGSQEYLDAVKISKYVVWPNFGMAPKGHILLQDHGNQVSFRSLKIKELN